MLLLLRIARVLFSHWQQPRIGSYLGITYLNVIWLAEDSNTA